jgi:hypothetical protein
VAYYRAGDSEAAEISIKTLLRIKSSTSQERMYSSFVRWALSQTCFVREPVFLELVKHIQRGLERPEPHATSANDFWTAILQLKTEHAEQAERTLRSLLGVYKESCVIRYFLTLALTHQGMVPERGGECRGAGPDWVENGRELPALDPVHLGPLEISISAHLHSLGIVNNGTAF